MKVNFIQSHMDGKRKQKAAKQAVPVLIVSYDTEAMKDFSLLFPNKGNQNEREREREAKFFFSEQQGGSCDQTLTFLLLL